MGVGISDSLVRLLDRFRPSGTSGPRQAFQARVIVGQCLLGSGVAVFSAAQELLVGDRVSGIIIAVFGVSLLVQLAALRLGVRVALVVWGSISALGAFLVADSVVTAQLQPEQLPWFVLLPLGALVLVGPRSDLAENPPSRRPVAIAALLATLLGAFVILAHEKGWTFGRPHLPVSAAYQLGNFVPFVVSATGLMWLYDLALRNAEEELRHLRNLLSVCSWCKKMHDAQDGWVVLEDFMKKRESTLTHGICPTCAEEHFPGN
jgi:hypothetical protein